MGRKSSAKSQKTSANDAGGPPEPPRRGFSPLLAVGVVALAAAAGLFVAMRPAPTMPAPDPQQAAAAPAAQQAAADQPPPNAKYGPHKQDRLPPLPFEPMPARSPE